MEQVRINTDDLRRLEGSLNEASGVALEEVQAVVRRGALNIKKDAQRRIGRGPYLPMYANAISYNTRNTDMGAEAEIGPDKDRPQGALGNVLEYGTASSAPQPHLAPALAAETPGFERALEAAVLRALDL